MNKQAIIDRIQKNYNLFIDYLNELSPEEFSFRYQQKWTAAQQLEHIVLCVKPLVQVYSMDKIALKQNFGTTNKASRTYDVLLKEYLEKLNEGGKAPTRYLPETIATEKAFLIDSLRKAIQNLCVAIETFTEEELDTLQVPHPILGNISLREMLYNAIYHVQHHHEAIKQNLTQYIK